MANQKMAICLWFDKQAEEAAKFYTSIFKDSEIGLMSRYGKEGFEIHKMPEGTVLFVNFRINDLYFTAMNAGPKVQFNESISIIVNCETQNEIDYLWNKLTEGGEESQCGWLKDKYGVSWQITPSILEKLMSNPEKSDRVMKAFMQMKKLDIEKIMQA